MSGCAIPSGGLSTEHAPGGISVLRQGIKFVFGQDLDKAVDIAMRLARPDEQYS